MATTKTTKAKKATRATSKKAAKPAVKKRVTSKKAAANKATRARVKQFICNVVPSKGTEQDWQLADSIAAGSIGALAALPASVDLRASWWKINNQENTGSCVGWATGDGVVRWHMVQAGKITQQ